MNRHLNGIVQATRTLLDVEAELQLLGQNGPARPAVEARWKEASDARLALIVAAIRDGVDDDLMRWAIDMQSAETRGLVGAIVAALAAGAFKQAPATAEA